MLTVKVVVVPLSPPLVFIPNAMLNNPTEKYVEIPV